MDTEIVSVDNHMDNSLSYQRAVDILKNGGVVAFPTETVYGLGALATDEKAVQRIFEAKGRPSDNPLIVHIGNKEDVDKYAVDISEKAKLLIDKCWPGPLTLVFNKKPGVIAENVTPGFETVGIRMPDHPVALQLLRVLDGPLAAPSANRSGKPSPTEANHVLTDLHGRIPLIVDGGRTGVGVESTVLDMTTVPPTILRPGGMTREMIESLIGSVHAEAKSPGEEAPKAPGMKYMHYAPESPLFVIQADEKAIRDAVGMLQEEGKRVAVIGPDEFDIDGADWYFTVGPLHDHEAMAANLYRAIRQCDLTDADIILAAETDMGGVGDAVMNRLIKAADGKRFPI
ncbi:threonylcarbamoyl-AMP synthase [Sporosarcina luteola]|uniref:Threonylcarbamoyl-AMP synthase n=1 Tax=Sporosarcina luteola TaxID=582850 RepID=A0A511Z2T2_9BACL|nr:L-threonylcarbamoyladenylate synthase [Sporosarcina luteola]GEN81726.1 threonylcarbamoyl-AMP synthase [Sporosarcina luteola]